MSGPQLDSLDLAAVDEECKDKDRRKARNRMVGCNESDVDRASWIGSMRNGR